MSLNDHLLSINKLRIKKIDTIYTINYNYASKTIKIQATLSVVNKYIDLMKVMDYCIYLHNTCKVQINA